MTTNEIIAYYCNLLIIQYWGKPKAYGTIQALVTPVVMDQLPVQVQNAFDIDTAVGTQLDIIGKYAGVSRTGNGFDGLPITLSDADFRSLIRLGIIRNMAGSSLATIQALLHLYFASGLFVYDGADMQMSYLMTATVGSKDLAELFVEEGLLPKPMGVQLASLIYVPSTEIFGFSSYRNSTLNPNGFNTYAGSPAAWAWLSYQDGVELL